MEDPHIGKSGVYVLDPETGSTVSEADYQILLRERALAAEVVIMPRPDPVITPVSDPVVIPAASSATKISKGV